MGAVSNTNKSVGVRTPDNESKEGVIFRAINADDIEEARKAVIAGDLSPTIRPVKDWLLKVRQVVISDTARQDSASKLLQSLFKEGLLILNPNQKYTKQKLAKYILAREDNQARVGMSK